MRDKYIKLEISSDKDVSIWLADEENNLVQKEDNLMNTRVLRGIYYVKFGILNEAHKITASNPYIETVVVTQRNNKVKIRIVKNGN